MEVLKSLDSEVKPFFELSNSKIRCKLTGHEMPATAAAVGAYAGGKKFRRAVAQHRSQLLQSENGRYLLDAASVDASRSGQLFCRLTCRFVAATAAGIERHVAGKRFRRALASCQVAAAAGRKFVPATSLYRSFKDKAPFAAEPRPDGQGEEGEEEEEDDDDDDGKEEEVEEVEEEEMEDDDAGDNEEEEEEEEQQKKKLQDEKAKQAVANGKRKVAASHSRSAPAKRKRRQ